MPPTAPIRTNRLILREFRENDLPELLSIHGDALFQRYEVGRPATEAETRARLERTLADIHAVPRTRFRFAVTLPPAETLVGHVSLKMSNADIHEWEIGWGIAPALWGQGIASEAASAVLRFSFDSMEANRVVAFCHAGNTASWRVMEKIGMQREARLRETRWLNGVKFDEYLYAILRSD